VGPKAALKLAVVIVVAAAALLYAGDFAWFEYRVLKPKPNDPFETLTVYYATDVKGGKVEVFEEPQLQTCIHSIFPHRGYRPCWRFDRSGIVRISLIPRECGGVTLLQRGVGGRAGPRNRWVCAGKTGAPHTIRS
jgi:hypothetical protein